MHIKNGCLVLFFLALSLIGFGQHELLGKVVREGSTELIAGVTISNLTLHKLQQSNKLGNYAIAAEPGDTILFSSTGYISDTVVATETLLSRSQPIALTQRITGLPSVEVTELQNYRSDSLKRRQEYTAILDAKHPVKLVNEKRPGDAPGLSFSPEGYFSKRETSKRKLKKRLLLEEQDYYIDYKFSASRVAQLTGLKGDTLKTFLLRYRPTYKFCRSASTQDMFLYINDRLNLFMRG